VSAKFARTIGISVDPRRQNKSIEARQENIQRVKEYMSKLVLFPRHANRKVRRGEASEEERKVATQYKGEVLPIHNQAPVIEYRQITEDEKKYQAYKTLRKVCI
jgi:large subunit ribosomal protein L13e